MRKADGGSSDCRRPRVTPWGGGSGDAGEAGVHGGRIEFEALVHLRG
ncbi:hypothetical protein ACIHFC_30860 [Streptomyces sp. NPDC052013]